jgi:hypothetical protein
MKSLVGFLAGLMERTLTLGVALMFGVAKTLKTKMCVS